MNFDTNRIVEIDLVTNPYEFVFKYEVFFNASFDDLVALARENEKDKIWTFNFLTDLEEMDDFSGLTEVWYEIPHCIQPIYIGNFDPKDYRKIIDQLIINLSGGSAREEIGYYDEDI